MMLRRALILGGAIVGLLSAAVSPAMAQEEGPLAQPANGGPPRPTAETNRVMPMAGVPVVEGWRQRLEEG